MPKVAGLGEAPRRSAPEIFRRQPPGRTSSEEEGCRLVVHRRSRSFSDFEFVPDGDGDGGRGDGRKQQQRRQRQYSQDQQRRPRHQPRVVDVGCRAVGVGFGRRKSFSYCRLPEQPLRLTIVKLDCSSFDVQVMKSASVSGLKLAVEEIFTRSPKGEGYISWSLVWGHFCLCYKDQKLIDDKAFLRTFGIKDGDELHFIRHVSDNYNPIKEHPRKHEGVYEQQKIGLGISQVQQESEKDGRDSGRNSTSDGSIDEHHDDNQCDDPIPHPEFKLAHSFRGWLSYSGLWLSRRAILRTMVRPRVDRYCPKAGKR